MKKVLLWILAFLLTAVVLVYQRVTGPTYEKRVKVELAGETVSAELLRTHVITADCPVRITVPGQDFEGYVEYKRFPTGDAWTRLEMRRDGNDLVAYLPKQPMAGKLAYQVTLTSQGESTTFPSDEPVVMRYKGEVPGPVLILHIFVIFGALFFAFRAGFEALASAGTFAETPHAALRDALLTLQQTAEETLASILTGPPRRRFGERIVTPVYFRFE